MVSSAFYATDKVTSTIHQRIYNNLNVWFVFNIHSHIMCNNIFWVRIILILAWTLQNYSQYIQLKHNQLFSAYLPIFIQFQINAAMLYCHFLPPCYSSETLEFLFLPCFCSKFDNIWLISCKTPTSEKVDSNICTILNFTIQKTCIVVELGQTKMNKPFRSSNIPHRLPDLVITICCRK